MKKILFAITVAALMLSCSKENLKENDAVVDHTPVDLSFSASVINTKALLNSDRTVAFSAGDAIAVFANGNKYKFTTATGGATATFSGTAEVASTYYALFPYSDDATISGNVISGVNLSTSSVASTPGTFAPDQAIFVAKSSGTSLSFKSVVALLKLTVPSEVTDLKEVSLFNRTINPLTGAISGTFNVTVGDGAPSIEVTAKNGGESEPHTTGLVAPTEDVIAPGTYYIPVLPSSLTKGLDMKISYGDKTVGRNANGTALSFEAGNVYDLGTMYKIPGFVYNSFESGALGETITGGNTSSCSVVGNPKMSAANGSSKVMKLDMTTRADGSATSGVVKLNPISTVKFPATWYRTFFNKLSIKFYSAGDKYYPQFTIDADMGRGYSTIRPNKVNGVTVSSESEFDAAYNVDDWNVLEWDFASIGVDNNSKKQNIANIQWRFFYNYAGSSIARPAYQLLCYIDDITFWE